MTGPVEVVANGLELGELAAQPPVEWDDDHVAIVEATVLERNGTAE